MDAVPLKKYRTLDDLSTDIEFSEDDENLLLSSGLTPDMDALGQNDENCAECCVLERKLKCAEELLNHASFLMAEKNREIFSKKVDLWKNDKGMFY